MYIIKNVYNKLKKLSKTNPVQKKKNLNQKKIITIKNQ